MPGGPFVHGGRPEQVGHCRCGGKADSHIESRKLASHNCCGSSYMQPAGKAPGCTEVASCYPQGLFHEESSRRGVYGRQPGSIWPFTGPFR
eukprot:2246003-Amphidinium_carterae.1